MGCWPSLNLWETIITQLSIVDASGCLMLLTYPISTRCCFKKIPSGPMGDVTVRPWFLSAFVAEKIWSHHSHPFTRQVTENDQVSGSTDVPCLRVRCCAGLIRARKPSLERLGVDTGVNLRPSLGFLSDCRTHGVILQVGHVSWGNPWGNPWETHGLLWSCLVLVNTYTLDARTLIEPFLNASETNSNFSVDRWPHKPKMSSMTWYSRHVFIR